MRTWTLRLGLSLMVVVGFWTSRLPAQEILVVPMVPYEPELHEPSPFPFAPRPRPEPAKHLPRRVLNHFDMCCQNDPYVIASSSWHYEALFVFGSSRWFFQQPCVPGQLCAGKHGQR